MRWTVEGADAKTGESLTISVEAHDEEEAERQARYNGMLVSGVRPSGARPVTPAGARVVDYRGVGEARPSLAELEAAAARVRGTARVVRGLGMASLIGALVLTIVGLYEAFARSFTFPRSAMGWLALILGLAKDAFIPVGFGIFCLAAAAVLRLVAARSDVWREREYPPHRS